MSPAEKKVVEYTSADVAWGPTTDQMDEIVQLSRSYENRSAILSRIFSFFDPNNDKIQWKTIYKNLLLVEHMCIHADMDCVSYFKQHIYEIERLKDQYRHKDKQGVDKGINVRKRAETVADLIKDEELDEKRREGQAQKAKYTHTISSVGGQYSGGFGNIGGGFGSAGGYGGGSNGYSGQGFSSQQYKAPTQSTISQPQVQQPQPNWQQSWKTVEQPPAPVQQPPAVPQPMPAPAPASASNLPLNQMFMWQQTPGQTMQQPVQPAQPVQPMQPVQLAPVQQPQQQPANSGDFFSDLFAAHSTAPTTGSAPIAPVVQQPPVQVNPAQAKQNAAMMNLLDF